MTAKKKQCGLKHSEEWDYKWVIFKKLHIEHKTDFNNDYNDEFYDKVWDLKI
jgi:hypothetical protein